MQSLKKLITGLVPATLGGAFFLIALGRILDPQAALLGLLAVGALCGIVVTGLLRMFRIAPWGYPFAGLLCGPLPFFALQRDPSASEDDRAGLWLLCAFFGALIGVLEWSRVSRRGDERQERQR